MMICRRTSRNAKSSVAVASVHNNNNVQLVSMLVVVVVSLLLSSSWSSQSSFGVTVVEGFNAPWAKQLSVTRPIEDALLTPSKTTKSKTKTATKTKTKTTSSTTTSSSSVTAPIAIPNTISSFLQKQTSTASSLMSSSSMVTATKSKKSSASASSLEGIQIQPIDGNGRKINLLDYLSSSSSSSSSGSNPKSLFIFGTYAADFNAIEYAQRLRYYLPRLQKECGVTKIGFVLNCEADAAQAMAELVDLDTTQVDLFVDNTGQAGKQWGVGRGWLSDDDEMNPFLKLFGMLFGLGAWATLPAVIGGYIGNPFIAQPWIEDALAVGMKKGRWPNNALEVDDDTGTVTTNKFAELPFVGSWARRPLELATLRLQSMIGVSLKEWDKLAPNQESLDAGVLTQLGGAVVVDSVTQDILWQWRDPGICAVANFEDMCRKLKVPSP